MIVNTGGARASDVLDLMKKMRDAVREKFGVTLMPEVELLGLKWEVPRTVTLGSAPMRILLMAGGGGTRLWPLSTEARPKQFLPLLSPKSLLAETWERLAPAFPDVWVATSARHAELVAASSRQLPPGRILTEPARRNSGPAILAAALRFAAGGDPVTAAVPTDQTVRDPEAFRRALAAAARSRTGRASSSSPFRRRVPRRTSATSRCVNGKVLSFVEKPDAERRARWRPPADISGTPASSSSVRRD